MITNGNAGTLDALNRGEIWMGVVWIDQLVAWKNEGRMDPAVTPMLPAPGPAHLPALSRRAARGGQPGAGRALHRLHRHARGAGQGHRRALRLVPRRRPRQGAAAHHAKSRELLFKGVSAQDLARYSRQMPLKEYHDMITLAYEEIVR